MELWLLEALAAEHVDALEECLASGMLVGGPTAVEFRHELARLAVEESYFSDEQLQAISILERAIELRRRSGDPRGEGDALARLVPYLTCRGLLAEAEHAATQAITLLEPRIVRAMHNLAGGAVEHHARESARRWLDAALDCCNELELDLWRLSLLALRATLELDQGRWTEAAATASVLVDDGRRHIVAVTTTKGAWVETYVILRRGGWRTPDELRDAATRSAAEADPTPDDVRWIRSYVLAEPDGSRGTVCVYQATSPESIRIHAYRARLPVDEIVAVADTVVVRSDGAMVAA